MSEVILYKSGKPEVVQKGTHVAPVEIVLGDGRTAQMYFTEDGDLSVRAWGNIAAKLGNSNSTSFRCFVEPKEPTHCELCYQKIGQCSHTTELEPNAEQE